MVVANRNAFDRYKQNNIMTASPAELTLMLYDGCLKNLKQALQQYIAKEDCNAINSIHKANKIIRELQDSLNTQIEYGRNLYSLYAFLERELYEVVLNRQVSKMKGCIDIVTQMRDLWKQIMAANRSSSQRQGIAQNF